MWEKDKTLNSIVSHNSKRKKKRELGEKRFGSQKNGVLVREG